jgi:hypothetical protein
MTSLPESGDRHDPIVWAEIPLPRPSAAEDALDPRRASVIGAAVAACICFVVAAAGEIVGIPGGWLLGIGGLPATTFLASRMGPRVVAASTEGALAHAVVLGIETIILSDLLVAIVLAIASLQESWIGGALVGGMLVFIIGAIFVGLPVTVIVLPAAFIWAVIVRFIVGRSA